MYQQEMYGMSEFNRRSLVYISEWTTFTVMQDISCKTMNLVYAIICSNCGEFYVGEIFVNLTMTLKIFINLITTLKMFINFIGNIFYRENVTS
jgi:hypothetical protein